MTSQYRHRRSSDPTRAFAQLEPGEIAVNTANRQIATGDAASGAVGNPLPLLPLRYFDTRAVYAAGDLVYYQNTVYRAKAAAGPGAFTPGQWDMLVGVVDPQYVAKAGDTMTGALTLSGNPSDGLHAAPKQYTDAGDMARVAKAGDTMTGLLVLPATTPTLATHATNKAYVDSALANKSSVIVSDTAPAGAIDNTLWWESDTGLLYVRYNDGNSTQWVITCPQPDTSLFVQRTGDTMTGALVLPAPAPTLTTHAANKAYVDATAKVWSGKNYIINGAMMVSQENGGTAGTAASYYPVDMFSTYNSGSGTATVKQHITYTPAGSVNRLRVTATVADATVAATDQIQIAHHIEGLRSADLFFGTSDAKTITIQFGVKAPAGTYCLAVSNSTRNRTYISEYVIAAGEANTDVVKSVTIPGDTTGSWLFDNNIGLSIKWVLVCGSAYHQAKNTWVAVADAMTTASQTNFMATANNVFELFDVSLTEGTVAPPFVVPDYASELLACQRYFYNGVPNLRGFVNSPATNMLNRVSCNHPVVMRAAPTHVMTSLLPIYDGSTASTISLLGQNSSTTRVLEFEATSSAAMTAGKSFVVYQGGGGNINISARL